MKIVAVLAFRNEESYLGNCARHLIRNGIRIAAIDNESTDDSKFVLQQPDIRDHIVAFQSVRYEGQYRWKPLLEAKMKIAANIEADWIVNVDADEIMHSYRADESLLAAITRIAETGCTVINMDEFVFLPIERDYASDCPGIQSLTQYYFFEPRPLRLMRAWKNQLGLSMVESGGHIIAGEAVALAAESIALRHYPFQTQPHAYRKYVTRRYCPDELKQGWHLNRVNQPQEVFRFPAATLLQQLARPHSRALDKSRPHDRHYWQWQLGQAN
jgi:glycosyltransferase involved in cell wall biosynthesis